MRAVHAAPLHTDFVRLTVFMREERFGFVALSARADWARASPLVLAPEIVADMTSTGLPFRLGIALPPLAPRRYAHRVRMPNLKPLDVLNATPEDLEQRVKEALAHVRATAQLFGEHQRPTMSADDFQIALMDIEVFASVVTAARMAHDRAISVDGLNLDIRREERRLPSLAALGTLTDELDLLAETLRSHFGTLLEDLYDSVEPAYAPLARLGETNKEIFAALRDARDHFDPSDNEAEEEAR
jgi:hypothetical protein